VSYQLSVSSYQLVVISYLSVISYHILFSRSHALRGNALPDAPRPAGKYQVLRSAIYRLFLFVMVDDKSSTPRRQDMALNLRKALLNTKKSYF